MKTRARRVYVTGVGVYGLLLSAVFLANPAMAAPTHEYTAGHADIEIVYDEGVDAFSVSIQMEGATVDGISGNDGLFSPEDISIVTGERFTRPPVIGGGAFFAGLGVDFEQDVFLLPRDNTLAVPFLGWNNTVASGALEGDFVQIRLVSVTPPGGIPGAFSLWNFDGGLPSFHMASFDGVDPDDLLELPIGHDHFAMGLGPASSGGLWELQFEVSGTETAALGGSTVTNQFTLHVQTVGQDLVPVPLLSGRAQWLALALGLCGFGAFGRRTRRVRRTG